MRKSLLTFLLNGLLMAQVYVPGSHNTWDLNSSNQAQLKSGLGVYPYYGITIQAVENDEFKIVVDDWSKSWSGGFWLPGTSHFDLIWNLGFGGDNARWSGINVSEMKNYIHINIEDPGSHLGGYLPMGIMTLSEFPAAIDSVETPGIWDGSNFITSLDSQKVTIHISDALAPEEKLYIRCSSDSWLSDYFIRAKVTATDTIYTAKISADFPNLTDLQFYALTTTLAWSSGNDLDNFPDRLTMAYDNNDGQNYNFIVHGNHPPVISSLEAEFTIEEGKTLMIPLTATDFDRDSLIWTVQNLPPGAAFTDNRDSTATFEWTPSLVGTGFYQNIIFIVDDGYSNAKLSIKP